MNDDGVALRSIAHPVPRFWWLKLLWWRLIRKDIKKSSLQTAQIEIDTPTSDIKISSR